MGLLRFLGGLPGVFIGVMVLMIIAAANAAKRR